jgi:hypothetical protein
VTEFEFAAHPVGTAMPVGVAMFSIDEAAAAIAHYERTMSSSTDDLKATVFFQRAVGPQDQVEAPVCVLVSVWTGDPRDARAVNEELWRGAPKLSGDLHTGSGCVQLHQRGLPRAPQ